MVSRFEITYVLKYSIYLALIIRSTENSYSRNVIYIEHFKTLVILERYPSLIFHNNSIYSLAYKAISKNTERLRGNFTNKDGKMGLLRLSIKDGKKSDQFKKHIG